MMSLNDEIIQIIKKEKEVSTKDVQRILAKHGIRRSLRTIQRHLAELRNRGKLKWSYNPKTKELKYSINKKPKKEDFALEGLGEYVE